MQRKQHEDLNDKYNWMNAEHDSMRRQCEKLTSSLNNRVELVKSLRDQLYAVQNKVEILTELYLFNFTKCSYLVNALLILEQYGVK